MTLPLRHLYSGKVRDIYAVGDDQLLMVTSDRLSAFDVVLNEPILHKGRVLTAISAFWFDVLGDVVGSHLVSTDVHDLPTEVIAAGEDLAGRIMLCRKAEMLPVECIVRGYLSGSAWKEYRTSGTMHGTPLPAGLQESDALPEPVFTPSTKSDVHDENISFAQAVDLVGEELATQARDTSIELYSRGAALAPRAGDHHRRHQVRARPHRWRARPVRRGHDTGLQSLLAARRVEARSNAAELRQAARAGLPRVARLGQDATPAAAAP